MPSQQWLLCERRNQAAEMRKQITGLMRELCQTFGGTDCDKIMDSRVGKEPFSHTLRVEDWFLGIFSR